MITTEAKLRSGNFLDIAAGFWANVTGMGRVIHMEPVLIKRDEQAEREYSLKYITGKFKQFADKETLIRRLNAPVVVRGCVEEGIVQASVLFNKTNLVKAINVDGNWTIKGRRVYEASEYKLIDSVDRDEWVTRAVYGAIRDPEITIENKGT